MENRIQKEKDGAADERENGRTERISHELRRQAGSLGSGVGRNRTSGQQRGGVYPADPGRRNHRDQRAAGAGGAYSKIS
ncbi:hypothetical protein SDC9_159317 [bioreactor metagenome]|uniref:Uncharacterized protein n=1 Tax=bioreactor metagenome TaxID=1076179 RepID=A0A645FCK2_9ZZZZ